MIDLGPPHSIKLIYYFVIHKKKKNGLPLISAALVQGTPGLAWSWKDLSIFSHLIKKKIKCVLKAKKSNSLSVPGRLGKISNSFNKII